VIPAADKPSWHGSHLASSRLLFSPPVNENQPIRVRSHVMPRIRYFALSVLFSHSMLAQPSSLPLFSEAATTSGTPVSARFFGGASLDTGASYQNHLPANAPVNLELAIEIAAEHLGQPGQLFTVVAVNDELYQYRENSGFASWDGQVSSLQSAGPRAALAELELLQILGGDVLGPYGLAGTSLQVFAAYAIDAAPDKLIYSSSALNLAIDTYDPSQLPYAEGQVVDTVVVDASRQREIPILVYLPQTIMPAPVVMFSHGLGGNRFGVTYLNQQWSRRGYVVVKLQHPGSDESILEVPPSQLLESLDSAASLENSVLRIEDVGAVLDQLTIWNEDPESVFFQRLDLNRVGMTGHSFGARTTQSVSGENTPFIPAETQDPRIDAAILFSPSPPSVGSVEFALSGVNIPWLLMTGTNDDSKVTNIDPEDRLLVFPGLPSGSKYELVLLDGYHHAFTDRDLSPSQEPRNPAHHGIIEALSTAFLDAYLQDDQSARAWLDGPDARSVLLEGDSWQLK